MYVCVSVFAGVADQLAVADMNRHITSALQKSSSSARSSSSSSSPSSASRWYRLPDEHRCTVCRKLFDSAANLNRHTRLHAEPEHECAFCTKRLTRPWELARHLVTHIHSRETTIVEMLAARDEGNRSAAGSGSKFRCTMCGEELNTVAGLRSHQLQHARKIALHCPHCSRRPFSRRRDFERHWNRCALTSDPSGRAQLPDSSSRSQTPTPSGRLQTPDPSSSWKTADPSSIPRTADPSTSSQLDLVACPTCGKPFQGYDSLAAHIERCHAGGQGEPTFPKGAPVAEPGVIPVPVVAAQGEMLSTGFGPAAVATAAGTRSSAECHDCPHCGRQYHSRRNMLEHRRRVHPASVWRACPSCGEAFQLENDLRRHVMMSHGGRGADMRPCPRCGKLFLRLADHLRRHRKAAANVHVCGVCGLEFLLNRELVQHMSTAHPDDQSRAMLN